jgi:hypothetical protein
MRTPKKKSPLFLALTLCLGLWAAVMIAYATVWGPWAFSDGVGYLAGATNLMNGRGLGLFDPTGAFIPAISHPPLYPALLAFFGNMLGTTLAAARWIDVAAFALLVVLAGVALHHLTGLRAISLGLALLLLLNPALVVAYTSAMAEPLFLLMGFAALFALAVWLADPHGRTWMLVVSTGLAALALLTRYAGLAFVATGVVVIGLMSQQPLKERARQALLFSGLSFLPVIAFFLWAKAATGARDFRVITPPEGLKALLGRFGSQLTDVVWSWKPVSATTIDLLRSFAAHRAPAIEALLALCVAALVLLLLLALRDRDNSADPLPRAKAARLATITFLVFDVCYLIVLLASFLSTTPTPDIDRRTTLPLQVGVLCAALSFLACIDLESRGSRTRSILVVVLIGLFALGYAVGTADIVQGLHRTGLGYTSPGWQRSETIAAVREIPSDVRLISNEPMPILLYTGRWPYPVAELEQKIPMPFERFGLGATQTEQLFERGDAALILFDTAGAAFEGLYPGEGEDRLAAFVDGLVLTFRGADGAVFVAPAR